MFCWVLFKKKCNKLEIALKTTISLMYYTLCVYWISVCDWDRRKNLGDKVKNGGGAHVQRIESTASLGCLCCIGTVYQGRPMVLRTVDVCGGAYVYAGRRYHQRSWGIADKMKSVRFVQIFRPVKKVNRTHKQVLRGRFANEKRAKKDVLRWRG